MLKLNKAPKIAETKNTFEGENLSAMVKIANTRVPAINPNCTDEVIQLNCDPDIENTSDNGPTIAFPANQREVQANCEKIMANRIKDLFI